MLLLVPDSELSCDNRAPREFTATIANLALFDGSLSKLDKVVTHFSAASGTESHPATGEYSQRIPNHAVSVVFNANLP